MTTVIVVDRNVVTTNKILRDIATTRQQCVVDDDFSKAEFCFHKNLEYDHAHDGVCVICDDCRLAGPRTTEKKALSEFYREANRVDRYHF